MLSRRPDVEYSSTRKFVRSSTEFAWTTVFDLLSPDVSWFSQDIHNTLLDSYAATDPKNRISSNTCCKNAAGSHLYVLGHHLASVALGYVTKQAHAKQSLLSTLLPPLSSADTPLSLEVLVQWEEATKAGTGKGVHGSPLVI